MEPTIFFNKESPDFNFGIWGDPKKIAANRTVLCMVTEYGLCNSERMKPRQIDSLMELLQTATGSIKESKSKAKLKTLRNRRESATKPIKTIGPTTLSEHTAERIPIENTS